jgi:hypothetical protein
MLDGKIAIVTGAGQKTWVSWGQFARWCGVLARTEGPGRPRHQGISMLIVDMDSPGVDVRPMTQITGHAEFCELFFDDVLVPEQNLLSNRGDGWKIAMYTLGHERGTAALPRQVKLRTWLDRLAATLGDRALEGRALLDEREAIGGALIETLAYLHATDPAAVGLADFGRGAGFMQRQLRRWSQQWESSKAADLPAVRRDHRIRRRRRRLVPGLRLLQARRDLPGRRRARRGRRDARLGFRGGPGHRGAAGPGRPSRAGGRGLARQAPGPARRQDRDRSAGGQRTGQLLAQAGTGAGHHDHPPGRATGQYIFIGRFIHVTSVQ